MSHTLVGTTDLPLPLIRRGKVRDVYAVGDDRLLLVASDRVSAFDVVMRELVPGKGAVLTQITAWWLRRFADEIGPDNKFDRPGLLAMANSGPNTNGCQFFITEVPTPHLNRGHTIFGEVVKGGELVPKIGRAGNKKVALEKVTITRGNVP